MNCGVASVRVVVLMIGSRILSTGQEITSFAESARYLGQRDTAYRVAPAVISPVLLQVAVRVVALSLRVFPRCRHRRRQRRRSASFVCESVRERMHDSLTFIWSTSCKGRNGNITHSRISRNATHEHSSAHHHVSIAYGRASPICDAWAPQLTVCALQSWPRSPKPKHFTAFVPRDTHV